MMKRKEEPNKVKGNNTTMGQFRDMSILMVVFVLLVRMLETLYVGAQELPTTTNTSKILQDLSLDPTHETILEGITSNSKSSEELSSEEDYSEEDYYDLLDDYYDEWHSDSESEESSGSFDGANHTVDNVLAANGVKHTVENVLTDAIISQNSTFCNWTAPLGPVCRYNNTNQVVVVPSGLMLNTGKLELEIHDAKVVHVYPACVSWVQIFNADLVTTMIDTNNNVDCRTWLRIYGSTADFVVNGVKDLTLIDSVIYTIRLSNQRDFMAINSVIHNIEMLEWRGYRGTIRNSSVGTIRSMEANDNFYIVDSQVKQILKNGIVFNSKEFKISNSTVHEVYENGIRVTSGAVTIENVEFNMLSKNAITIAGDTAFLSLIDIKVHNATKPCIILPARGRVTFKNVTINNENITDSSPYIHFTEDLAIDANYDGPIIYAEKNQDGCKVKDTQLICNFTDNKEIVKISQERLDEFSSVKIIGSDQLFVDPLCTTDLFLEEVTGTLIHTNMSMTSKNSLTSAETAISSDVGIEMERPCGMGVSIINSSLGTISCQAIKTIDMENTKVTRLHTGTLNQLNLKNVSIDHLVDTAFKGKESVFENVIVKSLANLTFYGPLKMSRFFAKTTLEGSLIFDHPNKTSVLSNVHFPKLYKGSILVRSGTVKIDACFITSAAPMSIIIEKEGFLVLDDCYFLGVPEHVVSVENKDQILSPYPPDLFLHIRSNKTKADHNVTILNSSNPHCSRKVFTWSLYCDFAGVNTSLDVKGKSRQLIIIKNANSVNIYPSLLIKLILNNVVQATTMESEDDYSFWLEGNNVTFDRIHTGVHDITLRYCRINLLAPDRELVDIDIEHTVIDKILGLSWKGYEGVFNNVTVGEINKMKVYGLFTIHGSHIEKIYRYGMEINDNSKIINSTLGYIASGGINITGTMHMFNVEIDTIERESIVVSGGTLLLQNVIIKNAEENSIMAIHKGGISFQNVTIGGSDIVLHGYFTNSEDNPNNQSVIIHNKPVPGKITEVPSPPTESSTTTTTIVRTVPKKESTSKSTNEVSKDFSKDSQFAKTETNAQSWGWAGAGTGFLCGILVGCAVFMVVKMFRSGNGKSFLPLVLWQVKDDQSELLSRDSTRNSVVQDGYTTLPNTDERSSELFTI
ncbi:unnamed protein product [Meganyctiphanes norvegica]|uniref:Uncharacterized protein n=1 Tax=Meganyctiphanes norvegica TaxID=48144 RepID=A0AAV2Q1B1_MEGNR